MTGVRRILFLQGMANRFFGRLGRALRGRGHAVTRVNFSGGDWLFWPYSNAINYRGRAEAWPSTLARILADRQITDLILFGDCRPLHRGAIAVARSCGVTVHVCEEGYIRPDFVTFEPDGVNGHSSLPGDPAWYRAEATRLTPPSPSPALPSSFARRAWEDFAYTMAELALRPLFPHYRSYRARHPLIEYAGWSRKIIRHLLRRAATSRAAALATDGTPYFLLPLQLDRDSQIRHHSSYKTVMAMVRQVMASFARHAPPGSRLVVKEHPLDDGLLDWRQAVGGAAASAGVADRVVFLDRGNLDALVRGAEGVVTVNSTAGTLALAQGVPVIALGLAIYDMPGLTHRGPLDAFWTQPAAADPALFDAFRTVLAHTCLLQGGFYSKAALHLLVAGAVARIEAAPVAARKPTGAFVTSTPQHVAPAGAAPSW